MDCPHSVLVIAWGNPLREDDAVAWHVLEGLRTLRPRPSLPALHLRHAHQLTPEMAECISRAAGVVFVDARRDGTPGEVRCEEVAPTAGQNPLAHSLSPRALLLYAEQLYGRAPRAVVLRPSSARRRSGREPRPKRRPAQPERRPSACRRAR